MSADDRREVIRLINEWNSSRYELFALSQPNEHLEFHGVMRFYFQDAGEKVSTKCIRVDSTASTDDVIKVLIEKFRPDMKSLSSAKDYAIYEVHADSQERKLDANERPLWIQLDWGKDGREGRFLLKNENAKTVQFDTTGDGLGLLRDKKRLSKREKKKQQKQLKEAAKENKINVAEHLYKEVPDSNFTRSISNPEIVMARRRQQKLENKLKQIKSRDGGGTLKVFGEVLKPDIPYKTLLMSNQDTAAFAVKETLEKYGLPNEDPENYCLVQVVTPSREEREKHGAQIKEFILEDTACPLAILMQHPTTGGQIIFQIRRCTPDILAIRKAKKKAAEIEKQQHQQQQQQQHQQQQHQHLNNMNSKPKQVAYQQEEALNDISNTNSVLMKSPCLIELTQEGFELQSARVIQLKSDFYEIGNDKYLASAQPNNYIKLDANIPGVEKKHCVLKKSTDGQQLFLIPLAETYINDRLVKEPTQLLNNFTVRLGKFCLFRFECNYNLNNINMNNNNMLNDHETHLNNKPWQTINMINSKPEMNGLAGKQNVISHTTNNNNVNTNNNATTPSSIPPNYGTLYDGQFNQEPIQVQAAPPPPQPLQQQQQQQQQQTAQQIASSAQSRPSEGLPGLLEFPDDGEDALLANICNTNQINYQFKLAPVYTMYMMLRFRLSQKYKSESTFNDKLQSVALLIHKMVNYIREAVDTNHLDKQLLPFWLANSSELLYFLKQDIHLSQVSYDAQELLADCVQITFKYLVNLMQQQLDFVLIAFFDPSDHVEDTSDADFEPLDTLTRPTLKHVIQVLNEAMNLLRGTRVNAALTIQLFSQLFHYISVWMFNKLVSDERTGLCSRYWGAKLTRRLNTIHEWAEKQGLELAADCHLSRIIQAAYFLQASKQDNIQDLPTISSNCFALNSLQIQKLLRNYVTDPSESPLSAHLCSNLISIAQNTADEVVKQEGRMLQLYEDVDLQLPFLLPEDGHSSEIIKGLPACLLDFLEILQNSGHCWLWQNTQGPGSWKKFMIKEQQNSQPGQATLATPAPLPPPAPPQPSQANSNVNNMTTVVSQPVTRPPLNIPESNGFPNRPTSLINQMSKQEDLPDFTAQQPQQAAPGPNIIKLRLNKKNNSLGLSIVAARGTNQINSGIYIKSVVPGGAADEDGTLEAGDQLLAVDEASLVNVTQEKAAELMCKSGPVVVLTIGKEAAYFHDLDALLNKSPMPPTAKQQHHHNPMATSMPLLNNLNGVTQSQIMQHHQHQMQQQHQQQQQQAQFSSVTLPRNHMQHIQHQPMIHQHHQTQPNHVEPPQQNGGYRMRSMSQEILNTNNNQQQQIQQLQQQQQNQITSPVHKVQPRTFTPQVTSPIRALPNEHMRYGSERPLSMHNQFHAPHANGHSSQTNGTLMSNISQRNLANELGPRYGSERPSSALASNFLSQHRLNNTNVNTHNGSGPSPIRQLNGKLRQASLSELDELNYNNQQQTQEFNQNNNNNNNNSNNNKFDDLYGKVNSASRQSSANFPPVNYANKASRTTSLQETVITNENNTQKPYGQLYEQIWSNTNQQQQQQQQNGSINHHKSATAINRVNNHHHHHQLQRNIDELNNFKNLEITNGYHSQQQQRFNSDSVDNMRPSRAAPSTSNLMTSSSSSRSNMFQPQQQNGHFNGMNEFNNNNNNSLPRNYENQIINHQQQQQQQASRQFNAKPIIPTKPFNLNLMNSNSNLNNDKALPPPPIASALSNASTAKLVATNTNGNHLNHMMNAKWNEADQLNRMRDGENDDNEARVELMHQRIEILQSLEAKLNRTNEEENRLNKLRTEIEFDKRVLEMNSHDSEEADDFDARERVASQMLKEEFMQRRRKLEELNLHQHQQQQQLMQQQQQQHDELQSPMFNAQRIDKRFVQFEDQQNEVKMCKNGFHDSDEHIASSTSSLRPQKHVQFMSDTEIMSPKYQHESPESKQQQQYQQDNNVTPPPQQQQQQQKRVVFSDASKLLEFERLNETSHPNTPCVIGANEIYVDQRLKQKQQQQKEMANQVIEGEKLSFKDKMKLFAKQSGELLADNAENKFKVSKKQREIESKFEIK